MNTEPLISLSPVLGAALAVGFWSITCVMVAGVIYGATQLIRK